jgi:flagellar FliJ protein
MKPRDAALRLKRFEVSEKARTVLSMESMINDFEHMANDLARQIAAEEERTGVKDTSHFAYSTFAKAASVRRLNLLNSVADLRAKLDAAKREHEEMAVELGKLEPVTVREHERHDTNGERSSGMMLG